MLDERINMELDVIDASRDAKAAVAQEKSRQKMAERRLEQLTKQQADLDTELSRIQKTLLKEQVGTHCASTVRHLSIASGI